MYSTGEHVMTWAEYVAWMHERWRYTIQRLPECTNQSAPPQVVCPFVPPNPGEHIPGVDEIDVTAYVRQASLRLPIPEPVITLGPDPAANEWNMAVVGLPVWLRTADTSARALTETSQGLTLRLSAAFKSVRFDLGDGSTLVCTSMPAYSSAHLGEASPGCGHTYTQPSGAGSYTLRATATWTVSWSAAGFSGTFPLTRTYSRAVRVGELQSIQKS